MITLLFDILKRGILIRLRKRYRRKYDESIRTARYYFLISLPGSYGYQVGFLYLKYAKIYKDFYNSISPDFEKIK